MRQGLKVNSKDIVVYRVALALADAAVRAIEFPRDEFIQNEFTDLVNEYKELCYTSSLKSSWP